MGTDAPGPTGKYYLQNLYQDDGWCDSGMNYRYNSKKEARKHAKKFSKNSIAWGTVRVVNPVGQIDSVWISGEKYHN